MPETDVKVKLHFNFLIHCNILLSVGKRVERLDNIESNNF